MEGKLQMVIWLNQYRIECTVYVFTELGTTFLLGTNAFDVGGLTLSTQRRVLFSEKPESGGAEQSSVALQVEPGVNNTVCLLRTESKESEKREGITENLTTEPIALEQRMITR